MKRKQTLLVMMTALFCAFGAGQLQAALSAAQAATHLNNNVRIETVTKRVPANATDPVTSEVYFDVKLKDVSNAWEIAGNSYTSSSSERPYLVLNMPLKGTSLLPDGTVGGSTNTAVAYYVGSGTMGEELRFVYKVRPGDMSAALSWTVGNNNSVVIGGDISNVKLQIYDTTTGEASSAVTMTEAALVGETAAAVTDSTDPVAVSGYTFTVGDADDNNVGLLYEGLVPVTVTCIDPAAARTVPNAANLYSNGYFWVETTDGTQYYNAGVTAINTNAAGEEIKSVTIKEANFDTQTSTTIDNKYAAKVGLNTTTFAGQKVFVNLPKGLAGQTVRLCYGVRRDNAAVQSAYAYIDYQVAATPIPDVSKGYTVNAYGMTKGTVVLPTEAAELKAEYTNLVNTTPAGGSLTIASGDSVVLNIAKNGADELADYGTLYASIERISSGDDSQADFEQYYVPINAIQGNAKVRISVPDIDVGGATYYRIRVPGLESANGVGTVDTPFYLKVTSTAKREEITLSSSAETTASGLEYYDPLDATAAETPGRQHYLKYTLGVKAADEPRSFLVYPTDETGKYRITETSVLTELTDANNTPLKAFDLIASYITLQAQTAEGGVNPSGKPELRVTVPADATGVDFYMVCVNDYAINKPIFPVKVRATNVETGTEEEITLTGVYFTAKSCDAEKNITGTLDECYSAYPTVGNRAPTIQGVSAPTSAATKTDVNFTVTVADAATDYLVLIMNYGDGQQDARLLVDENKMIAMMGKAAWDTELASLTDLYGTGTPKTLTQETRTKASQQCKFTHAYDGGSVQNWTLTVLDSSMAQTSYNGSINLESAQAFYFYTIYNATMPASGYVLWDNGTDTLDNWNFGKTYTYNSLPKNGGNDKVTVKAVPFSVGDESTKLENFNGPSHLFDSFFYMWSANSDYEALLPSGATEQYRRYEDVLMFSRAYVKEGEATDATAWQDIQLSAIFVAEYLPTDAKTSYEKDAQHPYLYELGDYNSDGVPDGWLLKHMNGYNQTSEADCRSRYVEGGSIAGESPDGTEFLPAAGWGAGDAAYRFGSSTGHIKGSLKMEAGTPFGFMTRVRGRDASLNAADGLGNWLSIPAWVVAVHPERTFNDAEIQDATKDNAAWADYYPKGGMVEAGRLNEDGEFTPSWQQIRLFPGTRRDPDHLSMVNAKFTNNGIPYGTPDSTGWAVVIDEQGNSIQAAPNSESAPYRSNTMEVYVGYSATDPDFQDVDHPNYEAFRYTYEGWGIVGADGEWIPRSKEGLPFPFAMIDAAVATADNPELDEGIEFAEIQIDPNSDPNNPTALPIDEWTGKELYGAYRYVDMRGLGGMLLDEPFKNDYNKVTGYVMPTLTSWLDRFPIKGAVAADDTDGDGVKNAAEYYFWYYASRIVYGSVFYQNAKNDDGTINTNKVDPNTVQLNSALWPAIDLRKRHHSRLNTDRYYGTTDQFTMGRRFRPDYNPDLVGQSYYGEPEWHADTQQYEVPTNPGDASVGKGNYWTPISALDVFNAFHPISSGSNGDLDNDGIHAAEELSIGTNPIDCDSDNDWIIDGWEIRHGLDPLNIKNPADPNDAEQNPDNDFQASMFVLEYPDYHHLFAVEYTIQIPEPTVTDPNATRDLPVTCYYDAEDNVIRIFDLDGDGNGDAVTNMDLLTEANCTQVLPVNNLPFNPTANPTALNKDQKHIAMQMNPVVRRLCDNEVYRTLGFNPRTAWHMAPSENHVNTIEFVSREEFNSAIRAGSWDKTSSSPTSADTNNDGIPDGWALYTGLKAHHDPADIPGSRDVDGDRLTGKQEFVGTSVNTIAASYNWPDTLKDTSLNTSWANKRLPTDPWNPDTDMDGLSDSEEGASLFIYGSPSTSSIVGAGCNPNNPDTDGDGMADGWEAKYGRGPLTASEIEELKLVVGSIEDLTFTVNGATLVYGKAPDPTRNGVDDEQRVMSDFDLDADDDGLTNAQEYNISLLRQLRYDLGPEAARIHKDDLGELKATDTTTTGFSWVTLPSIYNPIDDLGNPGTVPSREFYRMNGGALGSSNMTNHLIPLTQPVEVDLLKHAISASKHVVEERAVTSATFSSGGGYEDAITAAYNYHWNSTILVPTAAQLTGYGLLAVTPEHGAKTLKTTDHGELTYADVYDLLEDLPDVIQELDAAWARLLTYSPNRGNDTYSLGLYGDDLFQLVTKDLVGFNQGVEAAKAERQLRVLISRVDKYLSILKEAADKDVFQPALNAYFKTGADAGAIWTARKNLMYHFVISSLHKEDDATTYVNPAYTAYARFYNNAVGGTPVEILDPDTDTYTSALASKSVDYEKAVVATTNPLIKEQYRKALRGFNGGLWNGSYFGPLGWHAATKPYADREILAESDMGIFLGMPVVGIADLGAHFPTATKIYATTSPLSADSDMDGMDDYFEVFHGLNPLLGDYQNEAYGDGNVDILAAAIRLAGGEGGYINLDVEVNSFKCPPLTTDGVTGYDYYTYPWFAGVPFADPDGDGLLNSEEAVNPVTSVPAHYGTDPSPLWMTDVENPNSFVKRFYGCTNGNMEEVYLTGMGPLKSAGTFGSLVLPADASGSVLPYEMNEGYDTDGDGVGDLTELTSTTGFRGDPQTLRSPDRQQAAYFGGEGVLQTMEDTQFGPQSLTTFTLECWIKPDVPAADANEMILIDRPWRMNEAGEDLGYLRHNFVLGLRKSGEGFKPFAYYTGSGTNTDGSAGAPQASPEVESTQVILPDTWTHLAVTYDGAQLILFINGENAASTNSTLIPANGVIAVKSTADSDVRRFSFFRAPIMIGAAPAKNWFASLGDEEDDTPFEDYFAKCYRGFIDEVRIWNGARTKGQINDYRSRAFTQTELITFRVNAYNARFDGMGYYQKDTPAEPLAIYTFNDLLAGSRTPAVEATETSPAVPAKAALSSWERFPGDKLMGDATVPGSFLYRRRGFLATRDADTDAIPAETLPTEQELFTSYYTLTAAKTLRSKHYSENRVLDANGAPEEGENAAVPHSEFVPLAHNTIAHLPLADVDRDEMNVMSEGQLTNGSPELKLISGDVANTRVSDSVYWSQYRAGDTVSTTKQYEVKTTGNPYALCYKAVYTFDVPNYIVREPFELQVPSDLLIYGDVYAKYDFETWDNSPTTDPASGGGNTDDPSANPVVKEGADWFRHQDTPVADSGSKLNDKQYSKGSYWLEQNIANGQNKDSDGDLMPNWWENYYGLDPEDSVGVNGPHGDQDGDFLTNYAEHLASANPTKYSTVGNGVPDYQIPLWFRRGAPTFGLLYTDNDFMEDHWEASNRNASLTVDLHDGYADADKDGWSNFAEARANFRSGYHSTNPNAATSISQTGKVRLEMPTPALRMTVDYFGDQNVYTNATENAKIVVHAYTAKGNNSAPDATFKLPLALATTDATAATMEHEIGPWMRGKMSGYLHIGNIKPTSLKITFTRMAVDHIDTEDAEKADSLYFTIHSDGAVNNDIAQLYYMEPVYWVNEEGETVANGAQRRETGTINYRTGEFLLDFTDEDVWPGRVRYVNDDGDMTFYDCTEFVGVATYGYGVQAGQSNTYTLVAPDSGYLREGINNFFVFADLDGDGQWDDEEPAGIPDQHDLDIGFDQVNETLHVALTEQAPPGAVRLDVASILGVLITENNTNDVVQGDNSSIINPSTTKPLRPSDFVSEGNYYLLLTAYERIGQTTQKDDPGPEVYRKQFNIKKPYLSEDEIFGNPETRTGLMRTEDESELQVAASYKVYLIPETQIGNAENWRNYNIAVVTNVFGTLDKDSTMVVAPDGGASLHNSEIYFEWKCNVQVPSFALTITKVEDGAGNPVNKVVFSDKQIRGVSPFATSVGTGAVEQFSYRYKLPRGLAELNASADTLFGDGAYEYTLELSPYSGVKKTLTGDFKIEMRASGDPALSELEGSTNTNSKNQDSFYVRSNIHYSGVLRTAADFDYRNIVVEAHYSASFNGDPAASTSDRLIYDADDATIAKLNRCVRMYKDKIAYVKDGDPTSGEIFFTTNFDVELRGLPTNRPVYLMAYFDLNGNGKRDVWEPWGYATQGLDAVGGFYFDPAPLTPQSSGIEVLANFYIQDVDADSDKLADTWEWLSNGQKDTGSFFEDGTANSGWCKNYTGLLADLHSSNAIWTKDTYGNVALTAYGAQLFGLNVVSMPDANGAVAVEGLEDPAAAKELMDLIGEDVALQLINQGISSYGLTVNQISYNGDAITLAWSVDGAVGLDGKIYDLDLTKAFADGTNQAATYTVYGTATLGGTWTKLKQVKVSGSQTPNVEISTADATIGTEKATFFKVILSVQPLATTLE